MTSMCIIKNNWGLSQFCDTAKPISPLVIYSIQETKLLKLNLCEMHPKDDRNLVIKMHMNMLCMKINNPVSVQMTSSCDIKSLNWKYSGPVF